MQLSMCSDYARSTGNAEQDLRKIAEAGFDGVQWIHQWNTDFIYTKPEIRQIGKWLKTVSLKMFDLHATDGVEKRWYSETEYEREGGVEIVKNRVEMTEALGGTVIVMHIPRLIPENHGKWQQLRKSIDQLEGFCSKRKIRIAIENIFYDQFNGIAELMANYGPDYMGICYDSGHGNMGGIGLGHLAKLADRLIAIHLHDNNGFDDQHKPLFSGTVDWKRLASIIATSSYQGPLTLETSMRNSGIADEALFLKQEYLDAKKLVAMIKKS
jgi:sugar phosphate isomerase/epimerase